MRYGEHLDWRLAFVIVTGTWAILACTAPRIPIVWDEGYYLLRADQIAVWFRLLLDVRNPHGGLSALSSSVIHQHWLFINQLEGHPAWFAIPIALGKALLSGPLTPLTAARLGPITVFSVASGAVALRLKQRCGTVAALVAPIALLTLPRMFSEAHFATQDGQLVAWWLLLWAADSSARRGRRTAIVVGVLLGLTCATKFTGWLAIVPVFSWRTLTPDRQERRELLVLLPVALLTFYIVNPPLWHHPFEGVVEHVRLNLGRPDFNPLGAGSSHLRALWSGQSRPPVNVREYLFGSMTDLHAPYYPWYNTIAWLVLATPVSTLMLGAIGLRSSVAAKRWREPQSAALLSHWLVLTIVRALPGAPSYDGIRLILPVFGFWCVLSGIGAQRLWTAASRLRGSAWRGTAIQAATVAALAATALNLARYYPQTLSHYSILVGGVRGAARIGLEPTYWWDALDDDVLGWLNSHTAPNESVAFSSISDTNLDLLHEWGRLGPEVADPSWETFRWYVVQNRPGLFSAADRTLVRTEPPVYAKYAGRHAGRVPPDLNVPLILVFSYDQYRHAVLSSGSE